MPRHLELHDLFPGEEHEAVDLVTGRRLVLGNADVRISSLANPYHRNADDEPVEHAERLDPHGAVPVDAEGGERSVGGGGHEQLRGGHDPAGA